MRKRAIPRAVCVTLVVACGGGGKKQPEPMPPMENPAWAGDYERRADEGCACADADCLQATHAELAATLASHGGIDDAPPGVHVAYGKFDRCWRQGTRDIVRDFEHAAQNVCTAASTEALRTARIEYATLAEGKYRETFEAELLANPRAMVAIQRAAACVRKVTMPASEALAIFDRLTTAMCACRDFDCVSSVHRQRETAWGNYLELDAELDENRARDFTTKYCNCMREAARDAIKQLSPVPALTKVDVSLSCN